MSKYITEDHEIDVRLTLVEMYEIIAEILNDEESDSNGVRCLTEISEEV